MLPPPEGAPLSAAVNIGSASQKHAVAVPALSTAAMEQITQAHPNLETYAGMMPNDVASAATSQQRTGASRKRRAIW